MRRDLVIVGFVWVLTTVLGEILTSVSLFPVVRSDKGLEIEEAFRTLLILAVPVFTFVVAVLVYSVVRYRVRGQPGGEGPTLYGRGAVPVAWLIVTAVLAVAIMINPGLVNLPEIVEAYSQPDLVVEVASMQWAWTITYPQFGVTSRSELVLPVDRKVRFTITSSDVVHSFWIPAFLMRIDAVPGLTTSISLRPTRTGSYAEDPNLRLQCSQLCGLGHTVMMMPVRVVTQADFESWIRQQARSGTPGPAQPTPAATPTLSTGGNSP